MTNSVSASGCPLTKYCPLAMVRPRSGLAGTNGARGNWLALSRPLKAPVTGPRSTESTLQNQRAGRWGRARLSAAARVAAGRVREGRDHCRSHTQFSDRLERKHDYSGGQSSPTIGADCEGKRWNLLPCGW